MPADSPGASTGVTGHGATEDEDRVTTTGGPSSGCARSSTSCGPPAGSATCPTREVWFLEPVESGPASGAAARRRPWHGDGPLRPSRRCRALPRRLRPAAAGSRVGPPGSDGRGRDPGAAQGPRRRLPAAARSSPAPARSCFRWRPASPPPGSRWSRSARPGRRARGSAVPPDPGCTRPSSSRAPGTPLRCCAAAIPYRPRTAIIRIHGDHAVEAVTIARVDRQGRPVAGTEE